MKTISTTDKELVSLLTTNNEEAFRELYIRYKDKLWKYCYSFLKSEEETDDIIQEVFIHIWEIRNFVNPELSFSSFIYTMTRNRLLNYSRHRDITAEARKKYISKHYGGRETTESELILSEYRTILAEAIDELPAQRKKIFTLSRIEYLSHKEIAFQLGISVHTVQEHISAALRFIKAYFAEHYDLTISVMLFALL